ncbi:MAG: class C sortase [Firmicutes bacterium]|nr:class C sortase [Bacillota bacterium]
MKKKNSTTIIMVLALVVGLSLLLYPTLSNWWNSFRQSRAVASYVGEVANLDDETYERLLSEAHSYNETLVGKDNRFVAITDREHERYENALKINDLGIMGYVDVPKINVTLPIYHGTDDSILQHSVGHIEGSSLPVGGESTHCALSGHRGLPSARLFTDLDKIEVGDTFILTILNETLTYEVDQIRIVLPEETDDLAIVEGEDYCTLITCTPYGVNSHRMLIRGHRAGNEVNSTRIPADAMRVEYIIVAAIIAIPMLLIAFALMMIRPKKK